MAEQNKEADEGKCGCNCLKKCSNFINRSLEGFFFWLGTKVGRSPWITILVTFIISGLCIVGMLEFTEENRGNKLWVAEDSLALKHGDWVTANFPAKSRISVILVTASNVLQPGVLNQLVEVDKKVKLVNNGTKDHWESICFRVGPNCFDTSLLELWSFNETIIKALTSADILQKINQPGLTSPVTGRPFVVSELFGEVTRDSGNKITGAKAMTATYGIKSIEELSATGRASFPTAAKWEEGFGKVLDSWKSSIASWYYFSRYSVSDAAGGAIQGDVTLLSAGYMLIIAYVILMLGQFTRLQIKAWVALAGIVCVGLSIGVCFGLSSAFGAFYGPVHSTLPFLLLGIGVDDMFVIVQAWSNISPEVHKTKEVHERIALALKHAGCSITITSLTDFLAFLIGASTVLPGLRSFCIYAGIGIMVDFILQVTLFAAFLTLDARRQDKMRDGCCCCIVLPVGYTESECGSKDRFKEFFDKIYSKAILSLWGKITVMVITAALFGVSLYGTLMLRQDFDQTWFLPSDSMSYKYTTQSNKYFPVQGERAGLYAGRIDYYQDQQKLHDLHDLAAADSDVVASSVKSWYDSYVDWAKIKKPSANFDAQKTKITNETLFYVWLSEYLSGAGKTYSSDVKMYNTTAGKRISASRIGFKHVDMDSTTKEWKAMYRLRDTIVKVYPDEMMVFAYGAKYSSWETNKIILEELFRNIALALAAVFIVTVVVIANLWTALMVFTCVAFTLVDLCGMMHFWGLTVDTITTIQLVLAVGLAVDYSSHIGHTFMVTPGTRNDRARITLRDMGPAVANGGFSTFLAFSLLALSDSYIFKSFFKIFFLVVLFGMWHGMAYLPVLMSSIGPAPYESAHDTDHKPPGRLSPVYPASTDSGNDNVNLELSARFAQKSADIPADKPSNNGTVASYYIPPTDYEGVNMERIVNKTGSPNQGYKGSSDDVRT